MTSRVYAIVDSFGHVKIGRSSNPIARLQALQSACSNRLNLAYASDPTHEAAEIERATHLLLEHKRTIGEWFSVSADEAIEAIRKASKPDRVTKRQTPPRMTLNEFRNWINRHFPPRGGRGRPGVPATAAEYLAINPATLRRKLLGKVSITRQDERLCALKDAEVSAAE